jgi:hypothetical protein
MEASRYVGGADDVHEFGVIGIAEAPVAVSFTHVAVDIDNPNWHVRSPIFDAASVCWEERYGVLWIIENSIVACLSSVFQMPHFY